MKREDWLEHMQGKDINTHDRTKCTICRARARTFRATEAAKAKRQVYADMGMKRVRGNLGGVYYE